MIAIRRQKFVEARSGVPQPETVRRVELGSVDGIRVCNVSGHRVRSSVDVDFVWGGNPGRYGYVPLGEVWIEEELEPDDVVGTIVHELVEEKRMREDGLSYKKAHLVSNDWEGVARQYGALSGPEAMEFAKQILAGKLGRPAPRMVWRAK
jgi:hypothetical protein